MKKQNKAGKAAARARAAETGESYTRARRAVTQAPVNAEDAAPVVMPGPVAIMTARHLRAAGYHLGAFSRLMDAYGNDMPGPVKNVSETMFRNLFGLRRWADKTAVASGVIPVAPDVAPRSEAEKKAEGTLYPDASSGWCAAPGGFLPQPGQTGAPDDDDGGDRKVRHLLAGPVENRLVGPGGGGGRNTVRARDVVPGTPAAPIWEAGRAMGTYTGGWPERDGDSPADLAAAADGLIELGTMLTSAATTVLQQLEDRVAEGSITGVDPSQVADAREQLKILFRPRESDTVEPDVRGALWALRTAMTGAEAAMPPSDGRPVPAHAAMSWDGKPATYLRDKLGSEVFLQRQVSKTRPPEYERAELLRRMIQWCHATRSDTFDAAAFIVAESDANAARREGN